LAWWTLAAPPEHAEEVSPGIGGQEGQFRTALASQKQVVCLRGLRMGQWSADGRRQFKREDHVRT
jgi:hypothetical protein